MIGLGIRFDTRDAGEKMFYDEDRFFSAITKYAAKHKLPSPKKGIVGCGAFGCVWETSDSSVVIKATTDKDEIKVAQLLLDDGANAPEGIVRYYHRGKALGASLLWREAVSNVEELPESMSKMLRYYEAYSSSARDLYYDNIKHDAGLRNRWKKMVEEADRVIGKGKVELPPDPDTDWPYTVLIDGNKQFLHSWDPEGPDGKRLSRGMDYQKVYAYRFVVAWRAAELGVKRLLKTKELKPIGKSILWALSKGIMLSDVCVRNIGKVTRKGKQLWVIFDPGWTLETKKSFAEAQENPRPIALDKNAMVEIARSLGKQANAELKRQGKLLVRDDWVLGQGRAGIVDVKGYPHEISIYLLTRKRKGWWDGVTGAFSRNGKSIVIYLPVDADQDFKTLLDSTAYRDWGEITLLGTLMHEFTHARDAYSASAAEAQRKMIGQKDWKSYVNQPIEIRARMQELANMAVSSIESIKRVYSKKNRPVIPATQWILEQTALWNEIEPSLTPKNRNRMFLGVERALRDAGFDTSGKGRVFQ